MFTQDNTNGFSDSQLDMMNQAVEIILNGSTDADDVKNACDRVNNNFTGDNDTIESLAR